LGESALRNTAENILILSPASQRAITFYPTSMHMAQFDPQKVSVRHIHQSKGICSPAGNAAITPRRAGRIHACADLDKAARRNITLQAVTSPAGYRPVSSKRAGMLLPSAYLSESTGWAVGLSVSISAPADDSLILFQAAGV
jgi:hypothetical protein